MGAARRIEGDEESEDGDSPRRVYPNRLFVFSSRLIKDYLVPLSFGVKKNCIVELDVSSDTIVSGLWLSIISDVEYHVRDM